MPKRKNEGGGDRLQDYLTFNQNGLRLRTMTFGIPQSFYHALAADLGRPFDSATDPEVEEYIREVLKVNMEHVIKENQPKPKIRLRIRPKPKMKIRLRKKILR